MKSLYHFLLRNVPRPILIRLSYVFCLFSPLLYGGNNVECPVCGRSFRKFLAYGSKIALRENVLCPNCLSLERHRLMWLFLKQKTGFFTKPNKVLHIAPEQCFYKRFRKMENLDYTTGDLHSPLADVKFDLHDIPFADNRFHVVFCNHVLEHVEDDHRCMKELCRVLKPGGFAIMQVPIDSKREITYEDPSITDPAEREKHFWQKDHLRLYGRDYGRKLIDAGFTVIEDSFAADLEESLASRYRIVRGEVLCFCGKAGRE